MSLFAALLLAATAATQQAPHASPGADTGLTGRYDVGNPFARIIRGEVSARAFVVHEDRHVLVLVPLAMARPGHLLVIPKRLGVRNLLDLTQAELRACMIAVQHAARAQVTALGATGFQVRQNNGLTGGQTVFHPHFHVIPSYASRDEPMRPESAPNSPEERAAMARRLRAAWPVR